MRLKSNNRVAVLAFVLSLMVTLPSAAAPRSAVEVNGLGELDNLLEQIDTDQDIKQVAHELHYLLEQQGYILSFPKVVNEKTVEVSFGQIRRVTVEGFSQNTSDKIRDYFAANISDKPHISEIDRALALVNDIPGVLATVAFRKHGDDGNYEAVITGTESRQSGQVSVDTVSRTVSGDTRFQIFYNFNSVFQGGDLIRLQGAFVDVDDKADQRSVYGSYMLPIGSLGTFAEVSAGDFQTEVSIEGTSSVTPSFDPMVKRDTSSPAWTGVMMKRTPLVTLNTSPETCLFFTVRNNPAGRVMPWP
jgi:hemolysin activation/secretion protein